MLARAGAIVLGERLVERQLAGGNIAAWSKSLAAARAGRPRRATLQCRRVGLRAVGACEPRQIREEAALSDPSQVCGQPGPLRLTPDALVDRVGRPSRSPGRGRCNRSAADRTRTTRRRARSPKAIRTSTGTRRRRATSCGATATSTRRRGRRWTSGRRPGTCCCTRCMRFRRIGTPACRIPAAMVGVPLRAVWQIGLWAVVLPGTRACCCLMRRAAERSSRAPARTVAVVLGLGDARAAVRNPALRTRARRAARLRRLLVALYERRSRRARAAHAPGSRSRPTCRSSSSRRRSLVYAWRRARRGSRSAHSAGAAAALGLRHLGVRQPVPPRVLRRGDRSGRRRRRAGAGATISSSR